MVAALAAVLLAAALPLGAQDEELSPDRAPAVVNGKAHAPKAKLDYDCVAARAKYNPAALRWNGQVLDPLMGSTRGGEIYVNAIEPGRGTRERPRRMFLRLLLCGKKGIVATDPVEVFTEPGFRMPPEDAVRFDAPDSAFEDERRKDDGSLLPLKFARAPGSNAKSGAIVAFIDSLSAERSVCLSTVLYWGDAGRLVQRACASERLRAL